MKTPTERPVSDDDETRTVVKFAVEMELRAPVPDPARALAHIIHAGVLNLRIREFSRVTVSLVDPPGPGLEVEVSDG